MAAYKEIALTTSSGLVYKAEYYPHKQMVVRVNGFKVVVAKPYGAKIYGDMVLTSPSIHISTNTTVITDMHGLNNMQDVIQKCIDFLNNEGDGIIIPYDFYAYNNNGDIPYCRMDKVPSEVLQIQSKDAAKSIKSIPYKQITSQAVYEDARGHKWIYLGHGSLYDQIKDVNRNRIDCYEIYIDYDKLEKLIDSQNCSRNVLGSLVIDKHMALSSIIDSFATKKKFIRKVKDINWNGRDIAVIIDNTVYENYTFYVTS